MLGLSRNFGKEAALTAGLRAALGDVVVMLDADLQHSPSLIPAMIRHWQAGADVVYVVRRRRDDENAFKRIGARLFYALVNAADRFEVPAGAGDFRLMDRAVVNALLALPERNGFMKGLYGWVGFDAVAIPTRPSRARTAGVTSACCAFTTRPLRAVSMGGFALALLAFHYGGYLTVDYLVNGHTVGGWTTIVVGLMLFSGIQLIAIGIAGEYIARIFEEVKARPLFVIKRNLGQGLRTNDE